MQAGNGQPFGGDGIADLHSPRRRQQVRFLAKGERGNFEAVVADLHFDDVFHAVLRGNVTPKRKLAPRVLGSQPFKWRQWRPALRGEEAVRRVLPATKLFVIQGKNTSAELV